MKDKYQVLDGGMGTLLFSYGIPRSETIWAATAIDNPDFHESVIRAHLEYINAGATVITTNNYAIMPHYYSKHFGHENFSRKIKQDTLIACKLARKAIEMSGKDVFLFGCLQPTRESLRPDLTDAYLRDSWNYKTAQTFYQNIVKIMDPYVDGFLLETMNSRLELDCCLGAIKGIAKPIAISMQGSFMDPKTMKPQPYMCEHTAQYINFLCETEQFNIIMYALNCAPPKHITRSLDHLTESTKADLKRNGVRMGAYANATDTEVFENTQYGSVIPAERNATSKKITENYEKHAFDWLKRGVTCIGGCCKVGPDQIRSISRILRKRNQSKL